MNEKQLIKYFLSKKKYSERAIRALLYDLLAQHSLEELKNEKKLLIKAGEFVDELPKKRKSTTLPSCKEAIKETFRLLEEGDKLKTIFKEYTQSYTLGGSFSYGAFYSIKETSDLDIILEVTSTKQIDKIIGEVVNNLGYIPYTENYIYNEDFDMIKIRFANNANQIQNKKHSLELQFFLTPKIESLIEKIKADNSDGVIWIKTGLEPHAISSEPGKKYIIDGSGGENLLEYSYPENIYIKNNLESVNQPFSGNIGDNPIISHYLSIFTPGKVTIIDESAKLPELINTCFSYVSKLKPDYQPLQIRKDRIPYSKIEEIKNRFHKKH